MSIVWITAGVALWVIVIEALVLLGKYGPPQSGHGGRPPCDAEPAENLLRKPRTYTAAASVAPYNTCCLEDCRDEMRPCVVQCAPCGQLANQTGSTRHPGASDTAHTMAHDAPVLPFPAYALWTPPG